MPIFYPKKRETFTQKSPKDKVGKWVPCICRTCTGLTEPAMFAQKDLIERKARGKRTTECPLLLEALRQALVRAGVGDDPRCTAAPPRRGCRDPGPSRRYRNPRLACREPRHKTKRPIRGTDRGTDPGGLPTAPSGPVTGAGRVDERERSPPNSRAAAGGLRSTCPPYANGPSQCAWGTY